MTILSVINNIASETGLDEFTSVYGSNDPNAQIMLSLAKTGGEEISRRSDWKDLLKYLSITTSPVAIPSDFHRLIPGGAVRSASNVFIRPVTNGSQWAVVAASPSEQPFFFITGGFMLFSPPAVAINGGISYVSKNWIKRNVGAEVSEWGADDDTMLFPERLMERDLVWRWRRRNGLDYADQLAEFEADLAAEIQANRGV